MARPDATALRRPRVVIVGGGFGGTHAAHALRHAPVDVLLLDRTNHSLFHPLLYQVATAGLSADEIAIPIRTLFESQENVEVRMAEATDVDVTRRVIQAGGREIPYDYLVLATGSRYNYFGHDDWERRAFSLKTVADAARIRQRVLAAFEEAEHETDPNRREALLTFVLVGGGPTGVEMAGSLAELARRSLVREFRRIDTRTSRILLLEAGPRILSAFPDALAGKARSHLADMGVEVRTGAAVTSVDPEGVTVNGSEKIAASNVIWTAGTRGSALGARLGAPLDRLGRVSVGPDLSIPAHPEVFVVGDLMVMERDGQPFSPGLAPVAMQQGRYVGRRIARAVSGLPEEGAFRFRNKGNLATVGRAFAIAELPPGIRTGGFLAWLLWGLVHVAYLASLWNRFQVLTTWLWGYLTYERTVRVLTPDGLRSVGEPPSGSDSTA
jgi:NADH:ubiquinone reductase (H+-translocating)